MPGMAFASYPIEALLLVFALAGLPIIILAFHGVTYRNEALVRMYLFYLWLSLAIVLCLLAVELLTGGLSCQSMPKVFQVNAEAWACGTIRYLNLGMVTLVIIVGLYFQHVVWSFCEELAENGGGPELSHLYLYKGPHTDFTEPHYNTLMHLPDLEKWGGPTQHGPILGDHQGHNRGICF
mmetsp:Transcript_122003/g.191431  ORF Transcript_122003/g.191431 Transcript_122003/m.191431 type:complete len:180 (-) Transcript_122003:62-601(-)